MVGADALCQLLTVLLQFIKFCSRMSFQVRACKRSGSAVDLPFNAVGYPLCG